MPNIYELPTIQREALFQAVAADTGSRFHNWGRGYKRQIAALEKKGLIDADGRPTDDGRAAHESLTTPMPGHLVPVTTHRASGFSTYGVHHYIGQLSADGETLYVDVTTLDDEFAGEVNVGAMGRIRRLLTGDIIAQ